MVSIPAGAEPVVLMLERTLVAIRAVVARLEVGRRPPVARAGRAVARVRGAALRPPMAWGTLVPHRPGSGRSCGWRRVLPRERLDVGVLAVLVWFREYCRFDVVLVVACGISAWLPARQPEIA